MKPEHARQIRFGIELARMKYGYFSAVMKARGDYLSPLELKAARREIRARIARIERRQDARA
jgi:hypothetical protein